MTIARINYTIDEATGELTRLEIDGKPWVCALKALEDRNTAYAERVFLEAKFWRFLTQYFGPCTCSPDYTGRGLRDPKCQGHEIWELREEWQTYE